MTLHTEAAKKELGNSPTVVIIKYKLQKYRTLLVSFSKSLFIFDLIWFSFILLNVNIAFASPLWTVQCLGDIKPLTSVHKLKGPTLKYQMLKDQQGLILEKKPNSFFSEPVRPGVGNLRFFHSCAVVFYDFVK